MSARPLTPVEVDLLRLIADGLTDKQIASTVLSSEHTIKQHVKNILRKMPARNRTHAVATGFREGLIT